jgi:hypothetical protein
LWKAAYARSPDRFEALTRFSSAHPSYLETISATQRERAERDLGQPLVLGWILNLAARYQLATESGGDRWLVIDEGFAQRGVALFGAGSADADLPLLDRYVTSAPRANAIVVVRAPLDICEQRLEQRGWSERVRDLGPEQRRRFLETSTRVVEELASRVEAADTEMIWVDGTTPVPDSLARVTATLTARSD